MRNLGNQTTVFQAKLINGLHFMSSVETAQMFAVGKGQMSVAETAETGQMSAVPESAALPVRAVPRDKHPQGFN